MKSKYFTLLNNYSVLTCAVLIAISIVILFSNSKIPSVIKDHEQSSQSYKSSSEILTNRMAYTNNTLKLNKVENLDDFNDSSKSERNPINQNNANLSETDDHKKRNDTDILLYRKRRYLLFPEGSSFQIVFDLIIPIVDYTNYAIMGITCAVAWELPSKPPSEIENDLAEKLNDGTFGLSRNDSVNNIKYIDMPHHRQPLSNIIYIQPSEYKYKNSPVNSAPYSKSQMYSQKKMDLNNFNRYKPEPIYTGNQQKQPTLYTKSYNSPFKHKSINNERIDARTRWQTLRRTNNSKMPTIKDLTKTTSEAPSSGRRRNNFPKQHAVYHIMGKRSFQGNTEHTHPWLEKLDRIHLRYHRSSRHTLYSKIEVMFNQQGKNGTECVLRALCETGQKRDEIEPSGILVEILRAIFTLPKADEDSRYHPKQTAWDKAHNNRENCSEIYPLCDNFIWNYKNALQF